VLRWFHSAAASEKEGGVAQNSPPSTILNGSSVLTDLQISSKRSRRKPECAM
jgi:hypothetical protein